jgi:prepilin-type N-terminal cleavage/methylation domain-containing protein
MVEGGVLMAMRIHALQSTAPPRKVCTRHRDSRLRASKGFTLVEMLVSILIVALASGLIATGVSVAVRVMHQSTQISNAAVFASTFDTRINDTLRYASVEVDKNGVVQTTTAGDVLFDSDEVIDADGATAEAAYLTISTAANYAVVVREGQGTATTDISLVNSGLYEGFAITHFTLSYANGVFTGSYTIVPADEVSSTSPSFSRTVTFSCRSLVDETTVSGSG